MKALAYLFTGALLALSVACGDDDDSSGTPDAAPSPDASVASSTAVFTPPAPGAGADWGALPFPNDLYLDGDGQLKLTSLPAGEFYDEELYGLVLEALSDLDGAGVWTNVYFPIDGDIDPESLAGNVVLVDLDNDLAVIPADLVWRADLGAIVLAPKPGVVLRQQHDYAAYLTSGVKNGDGASLAPSAAFATVADLSATPSDAALAAAQDSLRPLLEALPATTASTVVGATVFRTMTVGVELRKMRDIVAATPPTVTVTDVFTDPTVLVGVQAPDAPPGFSYANNGPRAQPTSNMGAVIHGTIAIANFTNADPGVPGFIEHDADGDPIVKGTNDVAFTMVLPKGSSYANTPVMIFQHGVNTTRARIMIVGDIAASLGMATIAIDLPYHGSRAVDARDLQNLFTGASEADGFGDPVGYLAIGRFMHLFPAGGIPQNHPRMMRTNMWRAAVDISSLVSYVRGGSPGPINTALAANDLPSDLSFDQGSVGLYARSFGVIMAGAGLAVEPGISAAAFDVAGAGMWFPLALHSAIFSPTFASMLFETFDVADEVELGDPVLDARFHPLTVLWSYAVADADSLSYAPYVLDGSLRDGSKPNIVMTSVYGDEWVSNGTQGSYAKALGLPLVQVSLDTPWPDPPMSDIAFDELDAPVTGNLGTNQTGGLVLINPGAHGLTTWADDISEYEPELPPFVERDEPVAIINPTAEVQTLFSSFLHDAITGAGAPTIRDTFAP